MDSFSKKCCACLNSNVPLCDGMYECNGKFNNHRDLIKSTFVDYEINNNITYNLCENCIITLKLTRHIKHSLIRNKSGYELSSLQALPSTESNESNLRPENLQVIKEEPKDDLSMEKASSKIDLRPENLQVCKEEAKDDLSMENASSMIEKKKKLKNLKKMNRRVKKRNFAYQELFNQLELQKNNACKRVTCNTCGSKFANLNALEKHDRKHAILRYLCEECFKGFASDKKLQEHKKISHLKPFICKLCGETCHFMSDLKLHNKVHVRNLILN